MVYFGRPGIQSGCVVILGGTIQCHVVVRLATQAPERPRDDQPYPWDL